MFSAKLKTVGNNQFGFIQRNKQSLEVLTPCHIEKIHHFSKYGDEFVTFIKSNKQALFDIDEWAKKEGWGSIFNDADEIRVKIKCKEPERGWESIEHHDVIMALRFCCYEAGDHVGVSVSCKTID